MGIDEQMVDAMSGSWLCQSCEDSMLYCVCQKPFDEKEAKDIIEEVILTTRFSPPSLRIFRPTCPNPSTSSSL